MAARIAQKFWSLFMPAHKAYERAYAIHERFNAHACLSLLGPTEEQIALALRSRDLAEARALYAEALDWSARRGAAYNVAAAIYQVGLLERLLGHWADAAARFRDALVHFEQLVQDHPSACEAISMCHYYLGQALVRSQQADAAAKHLELAIRLSEVVGSSAFCRAARTLRESLPADPSPPIQERSAASGRPQPREVPVRRQPLFAVIGLASLTRAGNERLTGLLREGLSTAAPGAVLRSIVIGDSGFDPEKSGAPWNDPRLCAVVLSLDDGGLSDPEYVELLRWCLRRVARHEDFRLYVTPYGNKPFSPEAVSGEQGDPLAELRDMVQFPADWEALTLSLCDFMRNREEIRRAARWTSLCRSAAMTTSILAAALEIFCVGCALFLVVWLPVWDPHATLREYTGWEWLVAWMCGIASVPFLTVIFHAFTRHGLFPVGLWRDRKRTAWLGALSSIIGPHALGVPIRAGAPLSSILLGIVLGLGIDAARRRGYSVKREHRGVDHMTIAGRHGRLPTEMRRQAGPTFINPWSCALLPAEVPRVFISYSRSSQWGLARAEELERELDRMGAEYFRDVHMPKGGAWRRELNAYLGRATVLILFADAITVEHPWPAAEVEAALAGRAWTGLPHIIVITPPGQPRPNEESWRWFPVFRAVLGEHEGGAETAPEILEDSPSLLQAVAFKLHPKAFRSDAVFPPRVTKMLRPLRGGLFLVLNLWSVLSLPAAALGLFVPLTDFSFHTNSAEWLARHGLLPAVVLGVAVLAGHSVRFVLFCRYQLRHPQAQGLTLFHTFTALLVMILVAWWGRHASAVVLGWSCVGCATAFAAARMGATQPSQ
jgi:hypothetical protein